MTIEEHLRITIGDLVLKLAQQAATIDRLTAELQAHASPPGQPQKTNGALAEESATLANSTDARQ